MINPMELTGKHVLITGGSSGIGRQCAIQASRLGARVTLVSRSDEKLRETIQMMERPEEHACYSFDLNETEKIETLVKTIVEERGAMDGFCHAAGIATVRPLKLTKPAFVEKMLRIHAFAFIELVRCLAQKQNLNNEASLVGVSSGASEFPKISQSAYAAAKGSVNSFCRAAASELSDRGIRVNAVAFSLVDTEMYQDFLSYGDRSILQNQALGIIRTESAANVILFLLSDACRYITGSITRVYAGSV